MSGTETSSATPRTSSIHSRIQALRCNGPLFDHIATHPQSGIYERFGPLWPKLNAAIEGEVFDRNAAFDAFVYNNSSATSVNVARKELWKVTTSLADAMTLHGRSPIPSTLGSNI